MANDPANAGPAAAAASAAAPPIPAALRVLLVGNYPPDAQQSMLRYAAMLQRGLAEAGCETELLQPAPWFGRLARSPFTTAGKYLGYLDKFLLFPFRLRAAVRRARRQRRRVLVHICDHSNAMYSGSALRAPVLVTCHDLLAVRGALGEETDCPSSRAGRLLQRWIVRGLSHASRIACVSQATLRDVERLVPTRGGSPRLSRVPLGLSHPYAPLDPDEAAARLAPSGLDRVSYVLHVGSNQRRKNRETILRVFARVAPSWGGVVVFAGEPLSPALRALAAELQIAHRVRAVAAPGNALLEALYNRATALFFPSRFEGFGWPIIEAQACGCPVICSDAAPLPEVAGEGAIVCGLADEAAYAAALLRLADPAARAEWSARALANAARYGNPQMIEAFLRLYREMTLDP